MTTPLSALLADARAARGLSLRQLSDKVGVSHTYLGLLERGQATPTAETLARVCAPLGLDPADADRAAGRVAPDVKSLLATRPDLTELVRLAALHPPAAVAVLAAQFRAQHIQETAHGPVVTP